MRETNSNVDSSKASPLFLFPKKKRRKEKKKDTVCLPYLYAAYNLPHTGCHWGGFQCSETRKVLTAAAHYFVAGEQIAFGKYVHAFLGKTHL